MHQNIININKLVISALKGGSGKTILSIGIVSALKEKGVDVRAFKKGPDYIDAGWLSLASGKNCYSLDTFLMDEKIAENSFYSNAKDAELSLIEGNRGLFDGIDVAGNTSTAEIAKLLKAPVILCLDCTKSTRTVAATVLGCMHFDPDVKIEGVVLNRYGGPRHRNIVTKTIEHHTGIKVIGAIPRLKGDAFPERHMGLVPMDEHKWAHDSINNAKEMVLNNVDLDALIDISKSKEPVKKIESIEIKKVSSKEKPVIGIIRDSAFQFYYPENIEMLERHGAEIKFISPLNNNELPEIDALYIGGGFPETHAKELSENIKFRDRVKELADCGMPIYAECGGLIYLGKEIVIKDESFPMVNIFPISYGIGKKPQGHGYVNVKVAKDNPYYEKGYEIKGHEFRYSKIIKWDQDDKNMVFEMVRGVGMADSCDGACYKNVLATYTHIHALGTPEWANSMIKLSSEYKSKK
ncbi:MAG: hydrogenobyrinic acid a,c-diamide synthase (glutamine-hydrolyzing) [Proteobacteria bacterium]|nr:hydrogenobyrinic acid a,c-diamide synthase (glutamine-hydrolyzing) [Pseudomonadota bacterium]